MAKANLKSVENTTAEDEHSLSDVPSYIEYSENIESAERPEPLPVGTYIGKITEAGIKKSKEKGNLYYYAVFTIEADALPADYVEKMGATFEHMNLTHRIMGAADDPRGRWNTKRFCEAIGAPMASRIAPKEDWLGLEAALDVEHEPDLEGNPRPVVRRVKKIA